MNYIIILLIVGAAGMVLFSLARGLIHFANTSNDLANGTGPDGTGPSAGHLAQNKMMFARVKWQAITIVLLVIFGAIAGTR
jgi:Hypoxia induced protein conserved region